jgi:hypothetical protein
MIGLSKMGIDIVHYPAVFRALCITAAICAQAMTLPPLAYAQITAEGKPQATQSRAAGVTPPPEVKAQTVTHEQTYRLFISDVGMSEINLARAIRRNELPLPERRRFSHCLGIRGDADQIIYPILTDAFQDIQAAEQVVNNAFVPHQMLSQEETKKLLPVLEDRDRKEAATVKETIVLLRQKLDDADFTKLDTYIFELEDGGKPWTELKSRNRCLDKCNPTACPPSGATDPK